MPIEVRQLLQDVLTREDIYIDYDEMSCWYCDGRAYSRGSTIYNEKVVHTSDCVISRIRKVFDAESV